MNHITEFSVAHGALILFLMTFLEQTGLSLPAAPWLLAGGALAATGRIDLLAAIWWAAMGCLAADTLWFYAGYRGKARLLQLFTRFHILPPADARTSHIPALFRGLRILTAAKFLPLGSLVPLRAGLLHRNALLLLLVDGVCSLFYAAFYLLPGFVFHSQLERLIVLVRRLGVLAFVLLLLVAAAYLGYGIITHRLIRQASVSTMQNTKTDAQVGGIVRERGFP